MQSTVEKLLRLDVFEYRIFQGGTISITTASSLGIGSIVSGEFCKYSSQAYCRSCLGQIPRRLMPISFPA